MALICLASAAGSPGVTTSALALALCWPRPVVLVDADPTGSRAIGAGYLRGGELPTSDTVVDLAVSLRAGTLVADLPHALYTLPNSLVQVLSGPYDHHQAGALESLWEPLAAAFRDLERNGQDVIVDVGRLGLTGSPSRLMAAADLALLVIRSSLPAMVAASSWTPDLRAWFNDAGVGANLGLLVVGERRPYAASELAKVLSIPVAAKLAWDPETAAVYSDGASPHRKFQTSDLNKSLRAAALSLSTRVRHLTDDLALDPRSAS